MKSKLILRVTEKFEPFANNVFTGDWFGIYLNDGNPSTPNIQIHESPSLNRTVKGLFIPKGSTVYGQVNNLIPKLRSDWGNTGGYQNVKFTYSGDNDSLRQIEIELQNELWTFGNEGDSISDIVVGQAIDDGNITVASLVNAPPPTPKTLTLEETTTVDCGTNLINYTATITGGTAPYTIKGTAEGNVQATTGTKTIKLKRGVPVTVTVTDSTGANIDSKSLTPTIPLLPSYFTISVIQNSATMTENVVLPSEVYPITYSLDDINYQSSGNFPDLDFEETYTVYIKDTFGCTVQKTFVTPAYVEGNEELPEVYGRYFKVSNAGTLIINEVVDFGTVTKPNFTNTRSCQELVNLPYKFVHEPDPTDLIVQQFKSSYDYNKVTLVTNNDKIEIAPVLQSQNLRLQEKVDVKLFRTSDGGLGIYFRNGNTYIENTTTVNGVSDYDSVNLPSWAKSGEKINVDGIGSVTIKRISRDTTRGLFLQTSTSYSSLTDDDGKVQANYNEQLYNTYEFGFFASNIDKYGTIYIECGFFQDDVLQVERIFKSELIKPKSDTAKKHLFQWTDSENKAGIVHQTGINHFARLYCSLTFKTNSEASTYRGDNETFNLIQDVYRVAELKLAVFGHAMENKLHLAGGMEEFYINGISYKKNKMESERVEGTNIYIITATLETGGSDLELNESELVLKEPLTGITSKATIPDAIPTVLGANNDGLVLNGTGGAILISDS